MKNACLCVVAVLAAIAADAAEMKRGPWRFSVGPSWRERVKSSITGGESVTPIAASISTTYGGVVPSTVPSGGWPAAGIPILVVTDPNPLAPPGSILYAATVTRTDTVDVPNSGFGDLSNTDERGSLGVKSAIGYDFYDNGTFAIGLDLRFAAYWRLKSSSTGSAGGGVTQVNTYTDYYLFSLGPVPATPTSPFPASTPFVTDPTPYQSPLASSVTTGVFPSTPLSARVTSDMYQIGLGPTFTWHVCDCIDAYAKAALLCNLINMDFDVNGASQSSTLFRFGAGADVGAVAWFTDNVGIYADVGYEWIDEADVRISNTRGKADFSSLTVGAGLMVGF